MVDDVDCAFEKVLEIFFWVDVVAVPRFHGSVAEVDQEVDIAGVGVEVADGCGTEDLEPLDAVASAEFDWLVGVLGD